MIPRFMRIGVVGGGPTGLRAAEVAASRGAEVTLFDAKPSVGRKFLVAGRGGLNITKSEPLDLFCQRYQGPDMPSDIWPSLLADFSPDALRAWASDFGVETFVASTGRVYPREMKAAPLLRRWVHRLRDLGVQFSMHHRWLRFQPGEKLTMEFTTPTGTVEDSFDAVILAFGGGSWPATGSDGHWLDGLRESGIGVSPLQPANCGWEIDWPEELLTEAEGLPLKNVSASALDQTAVGELLITRYGLEGGVIYQLGATLRAMASPSLSIDLKPSVKEEDLLRKLGPVRKNFLQEASSRWRLGPAATALLRSFPPDKAADSAEAWVHHVKHFPLVLKGPRPIAEAISSAGGVCWRELDSNLMLVRRPGVFCAGEMIDWEAPTGGYLMQGCFASGTRAARAACEWASRA